MADLIRSQVCERVGLTVRELLELVRDGRFPPGRVAYGGSPPMWSEKDIAAWEQSAWTDHDREPHSVTPDHLRENKSGRTV